MLIHDCPHSFEELARTVLPGYMTQMRVALKAPHQAALFSSPGSGPASIARKLQMTSDFSGCYALIDTGKPIYVGISRKVLARLRQHFTGKTHFDASLAYRIAQRRLPTLGKRSEAMKLPRFQREFSAAQKYLCTLDVAFVEIQNPLELYVFEAFAAIELCTHEWNTFRTH
jgi:hypothetical protein